MHLLGGVLACALAAAPALCGAQTDPASSGGTAPAAAPGQSSPAKNFLDWLLHPQRAKSGETAPVTAPVEPAQRAPMPSVAAPAPASPAAEAVPAPTAAPPAPAPPLVTAPAAAAPAGNGAINPVPGVTFEHAPAPAPAPRSGMALILPAKAEGFGQAADVTLKGFMAAREIASDKPVVQVLETDGTAAGAIAAYRDALAKNVSVIVGPLTKTEVAAVQGEPIRVPTLMLNVPDGPVNAVHGLYLLSLSIELEARYAAEAAYRPQAAIALIVTSVSPLAKRAAGAFVEDWSRQGGVVKEVVEYAGNPIKVKRSVDQNRPDVVFLALDAERAKVLKPFIARNVVVIATSQVYSGMPRSDAPRPNELNGLEFVDIPWLHQPDHPATMAYPHLQPSLSADLERLYALGIDAFRVAQQLARERSDFEIDGVTGKLVVGGGVIERTPILAEYRDGLAVAREAAGGPHDHAAVPVAAPAAVR